MNRPIFDDELKSNYMTDEEVETHIGLGKVRAVMDGLDKEHGIEKIRKIIHEVRQWK